ncbi:hypothetical protein KP79_PYT12950 [Mizuhopecten yessoensis]|uniref:Uncharacterized protein n=1 Tax=Mizuhopecten yessoensis TaxID=6573 RepID=A0A210PGH3_MIZYE|nr:hypothetical protein KP79_PYT12950 [Mizuhopecten yessoensis]
MYINALMYFSYPKSVHQCIDSTDSSSVLSLNLQPIEYLIDLRSCALFATHLSTRSRSIYRGPSQGRKIYQLHCIGSSCMRSTRGGSKIRPLAPETDMWLHQNSPFSTMIGKENHQLL